MLIYPFHIVTGPDGSLVARPDIWVNVQGTRAKMDFRATLDSGADVSIVNKRVADFLGIVYDESSSYHV